MASAFVKYGEGDAFVADKRNFKGKSRDMLHSRSSGEREESFNYYGKKLLRCYRRGKIGHGNRYYRAKESNMAQKLAGEEEDGGKCLVVEARAINDMFPLTLKKTRSIL